MSDGKHELGKDVYFRWLAFAPDRELNPHLAEYADNDRTGIIFGHIHEDGYVCESGVTFDTPENTRDANKGRPVWQVQSLEPLTISPSILVTTCGFHGFIREGKWVSC